MFLSFTFIPIVLIFFVDDFTTVCVGLLFYRHIIGLCLNVLVRIWYIYLLQLKYKVRYRTETELQSISAI